MAPSDELDKSARRPRGAAKDAAGGKPSKTALGAALRENLRRRKAQSAARTQNGGAPEPQPARDKPEREDG